MKGRPNNCIGAVWWDLQTLQTAVACYAAGGAFHIADGSTSVLRPILFIVDWDPHVTFHVRIAGFCQQACIEELPSWLQGCTTDACF